jgi:ABC-type amino acid transport system permease subunit
VKEVTLVAQGLVFTTFRPFEVYSVLAVLYLMVIVPLTFGTRYLERATVRRLGGLT